MSAQNVLLNSSNTIPCSSVFLSVLTNSYQFNLYCVDYRTVEQNSILLACGGALNYICGVIYDRLVWDLVAKLDGVMHVLEYWFVALTTQRRQATYAVLYRNQNDQFNFTRTGLWQLMTWLTLRPGHYRLMYWLFRPTSPCFNMMTSSNGNTISVTGHLCEEFTSHRWIPIKGQWRRALMFSLICVWINGWVNSGEDGDLRRNRAHYNVTVMISTDINYIKWQLITWLI